MKGEAGRVSCGRPGAGLAVLLLLLLLTGCGNIQLYTNMPEQTVNEMLALLLNHNLPAKKKPGDKGTWNLVVERSGFAAAMDVLSANGYPREMYGEFVSEAFKRQGLVSSPREERARFTYAQSVALAQTISQIDGVINARVHLVIPEPNPLLDVQLPSSAAVFVKHSQDYDIRGFVPQIKQLVQNSIEGLAYDKISVVLTPSTDPRVAQPLAQELTPVMGILVASGSAAKLRGLALLLGGLLLASWAGLAYVLFLRKSSENLPTPASRKS